MFHCVRIIERSASLRRAWRSSSINGNVNIRTMKTLYFDCFSGISGDMTIGALLDLGLDLDYLKTELKKLPVAGYELKASRVTRSNISAMKFDVSVDGEEAHDHHHDHQHSHGGFHRKASQILEMIGGSNLNANTKRRASDIF